MRMYDLIMKKRNGGELTREELHAMIKGYVDGDIPDYQMSAFCMAVYFQGMTDRETADLTMEMAGSGDMIDLSSIDGIKVDKHSTGGVGDKTSLILVPTVAACGVRVAKMSGRGLGHTGGTLDKLESIPGCVVEIPQERFFEIVKEHGLCIAGQTGNLTPADKKLYALRDVTATVDTMPLIASSIMSKKLASGSDCIVLDVKTGSGSFMKTVDDSITLAQKMVAIGEHAGRKVVALITDMDRPLGHAIGNSLEVKEAVATLNGKGPEDLTKVCMDLAANMLHLAGKGSVAECRKMAEEAISSGRAFQKLQDMIAAQGGDTSVLRDVSLFEEAAVKREILAQKSGYIAHMNTELCGMASCMLGAGRETKEASIDYSAGIMTYKKTGDYVEAGEPIAVFYTSSEALLARAEETYQNAITITSDKQADEPLVFARVAIDGVERYDV